jgi:hypothetical protein
MKSPDFLLIGNPESKRVELFQKALTELKLPLARILPYQDLLSGKTHLTEVVRENTIVRLESPDKDFAIEKMILALGAEVAEQAGDFSFLSTKEVAKLDFEQGLILYPRQWYLGYCQLLQQIKQQLQNCSFHHLMNNLDDIAVMFDKVACHALLKEAEVSVPRSLGVVQNYDELIGKMQESGIRRVFIKLAHGSSASGAVAYQTNGNRHRATTTVEIIEEGNELKLYNTRRVHTLHNQNEIIRLINVLCRHRVQVEQWIPKAGFQNRIFDLRVLVIGGQAQHVVVRLSQNPFTNLHLANGRTWLDDLLTRLEPTVWGKAKQTCEKVAALFPKSLYAGIDLLIASDYKNHAVAEVNAFGDLLYHALYNKRDPYTAEIEAVLHQMRVTA